MLYAGLRWLASGARRGRGVLWALVNLRQAVSASRECQVTGVFTPAGDFAVDQTEINRFRHCAGGFR